MLCQNCFKKNAEINFIRIIENNHEELNLCKSCMEDMGLHKSVSNLPQIFTGLVIAILKLKEKDSSPSIRYSDSQHCPVCGCEWSEFESRGLIGCGNCFFTFLKQFDELLERIQGINRHSGKRPKISSEVELKKNLLFLERALQEAVNKEEYEKAAEFRDKIRSIKQ